MSSSKPIPTRISASTNAVSPVTATVLMLAVTLVLSTVLLALVLAMVDDGSDNGNGTASLPTGSGTSEDPYLIRSLDDMLTMMDDREGHYALAADIDATSTRFINDGDGFEPMFPFGSSFGGSFDGRQYIITGLYINRPNTNQVGLFGVIGGGATITNITLVDADITGRDRVGGIAGRSTGTIDNCHVSGSVAGANEAGGLLGVNWNVVTRSSSEAQVTATGDMVGGLIGNARTGSGNTVSNSYATGQVSGAEKVGGLIGQNGLVGSAGPADVINCYSTGSVSGTVAGGLIGANGGIVSSSFWDTTASGMGSSAAGTGIGTAAMKSPGTFTSAGWSESTWLLQSGQYPELKVKMA